MTEPHNTPSSEPRDHITIAITRTSPLVDIPHYRVDGDAGMDLQTRVNVTLRPGQRALVPCGIAISLPDGYVGLIHPRSGLAARHGITIVNAPGTIDSGYRGEIHACLLNTDVRETATFAPGDRIAQLVIQRYTHATFVEVDNLDLTERGNAGFGSTGTH